MSLGEEPDESLADEIVLPEYPLPDRIFDGQSSGGVVVDLDGFGFGGDCCLLAGVDLAGLLSESVKIALNDSAQRWRKSQR